MLLNKLLPQEIYPIIYDYVTMDDSIRLGYIRRLSRARINDVGNEILQHHPRRCCICGFTFRCYIFSQIPSYFDPATYCFECFCGYESLLDNHQQLVHNNNMTDDRTDESVSGSLHFPLLMIGISDVYYSFLDSFDFFPNYVIL